LKVLLGPVSSNVQVAGNLHAVIEMFEQVLKEPVAQLAEKSSQHHIEFLEFSLHVAAGQEALDDNHYQQDLERQKGEVAEQIEEYVVNIAKNEIMDEICNS